MSTDRFRDLAHRHQLSVEAQTEFARLLDDVRSQGADTMVLDAIASPVNLESAEPTFVIEGATSPVKTSGYSRYQDLGLLGRGAMGEVRRVLDRDLNRQVAMKILHDNLPASLSTRFIEEAQLTAQLEHPAIVPVHAFGRRPDGRFFFTMREIKGRNLHQLIQLLHAGRGSLRRLVDVFAVVCEAVGYAHAHGVIHRDLKPSNIMVGTHGQVYVVDWGLAREIHTNPQAGEISGTPGFMAPEAAQGCTEEVGPRTDVYALGATLYQLLCGRRPFAGQSTDDTLRDTVVKPTPRPQLLVDSPVAIAPALADLCMSCMAKPPGDRPATATDIAAVIRSWQDGEQRRERADVLVTHATEVLAHSQGATAKAAELRAAAVEVAVEITSSVDDKLPGWRLEDKADRLERQARLDEGRHLQLLRGALTMDPDHPGAHGRLAAWARREHEAAEVLGLSTRSAEVELLLRDHDRAGDHREYLDGRGRITLHTDRPAEATLFRYEYIDRRLVPVLDRRLGPTPVLVDVLHGSWLVLLQPEVGPPVRVPIQVERLGVWSNIRPGDENTTPVALPMTMAADQILISAGPFHAGGDSAVPCLPRREIWVDGFVVERFPVTNRRYLDFLNALVDAGRGDEATEYCPQVRGGDLVYGRTNQERFVLQPDADGDLWRLQDPVMMVDFPSARAFATWRTAVTGQPWRLPTENEWEKAARGVDGRVYPWGSHPDPTWMCIRPSHPGPPRPPAVADYPGDESPYGVRGMAGGVRDWCSSRGGSEGTLLENGCDVVPSEAELDAHPETFRSYRGGDWYGLALHARVAYRAWNKAQTRNYSLGFRLVRSL